MIERTFKLYIVAVALLLPTPAISEVVIATETGRGEYEDGVFTPGKPEFRYRFEIDESASRANLTESIRLENGSIIEDGTEYVITSTEDGSSLSAQLLFSERRSGQTVLTIVGKPGRLAIEVFILGETFFEYCKASSGRLYLATGTIQRTVSEGEDTQKRLLEGLLK